MQASSDLPDHPPGTACTFCPAGGVGRVMPYLEPGGQSRVKVELILKVESFCKSRMNFSASGIPGGAFLCTFVLFGSSQNLMYVVTSIRCSLNRYLAKYALKRHILTGCGPSWRAPAGPEGAAVRVRRFVSRCQSRTVFKVELNLSYALLLHDSGIYPVILTISHGYLFQTVVLEEG